MPKELNDLDLTEALFCLFTGAPGSRKTTALASFPEPYIIDPDGKIGSVKRFFPSKKIMYDQPDNFDQLLDILTGLANGSCPYGTVAIDSCTSTSDLIFKLACTYREGTKLTVGKNVELLQIQDYNMEMRSFIHMMDLLRIIHKKKVNVILTAHIITSESTDLKTKIVTRKSSILTAGQKAAIYVPSKVQEVYYFHTNEGYAGRKNFICSTKPTDGFNAMTSLDLPTDIDWTEKNFYEVLMSYVGKDS